MELSQVLPTAEVLQGILPVVPVGEQIQDFHTGHVSFISGLTVLPELVVGAFYLKLDVVLMARQALNQPPAQNFIDAPAGRVNLRVWTVMEFVQQFLQIWPRSRVTRGCFLPRQANHLCDEIVPTGTWTCSTDEHD